MSDIQDSISVRELVVVDDANRPRAVLTCPPGDGPPQLHLLDVTGTPRLILSLDSDGTPHVTLLSATFTALGSFGLDSQGKGAGLTLWSENGCFHRGVGVSDDGFNEEYTALAPKKPKRSDA